MRSGPLRGFLLALLVLLAGCGGLLPGAPDSGGDTGSDGEISYGLAVENGAAENRTFTLRVLDDERVVLNRSRRLAAGERWHVVNMSDGDYPAERYTVRVLVDGDQSFETTASFRESRTVERISGASLVVLGGSSSAHYTCGGNVTCYEAQVD